MNMQIKLANLIMRIQKKKQGCKLFVSEKKKIEKKNKRQTNEQAAKTTNKSYFSLLLLITH